MRSHDKLGGAARVIGGGTEPVFLALRLELLDGLAHIAGPAIDHWLDVIGAEHLLVVLQIDARALAYHLRDDTAVLRVDHCRFGLSLIHI